MFTNVDARCHPQRKNKAVFLCNTFSWLNISGFILFTFIERYLRPHTSESDPSHFHAGQSNKSRYSLTSLVMAASVLFTEYSV